MYPCCPAPAIGIVGKPNAAFDMPLEHKDMMSPNGNHS